MDWQLQREIWNDQGKCSREACQSSLIRRGAWRFGIHRDSGLKYCCSCTRQINQYNPMPDGIPLVVWTDNPMAPFDLLGTSG